MAEIPEKLADLMETFAMIEDRQERIELLISTADRFKGVPEAVATRPYPESHRVRHCESEAFVFSEERADGTLNYHFAVENPQGISAMATAVILDETVSGQAPEKVLSVSEDVIYAFFGNELSMGKSMGLTALIQMVKAETKRFVRKSESVEDRPRDLAQSRDHRAFDTH